MIRSRSLRLRLLLGAAALIALALAATGLTLSALFRDHVAAQYQAELVNHLNHLTSLLQIDANGTLALAGQPSDPRFLSPYGGRYWQVERPGAAPLRSRSLWDQTLTLEPDTPPPGALHQHEDAIPGIGRVRIVERLVHFSEAPQYPLRVAVALPTAEIDAVTDRFDRLLALALAVLALGLLAASGVQVTLGLSPLARLGQALARIRSGAASRLEGDFPSEVQPLAEELNAVLAHHEAMLERAQAQAADLAHGLKTSLQLLLLEADRLCRTGHGEQGAVIREQATRMQVLIEHQLARARAQAHQRHRHGAAPVAKSVAAVMRVLAPLAAERGVAIAPQVPPEHGFAGDAADLEEMIGNLLDNACKWAAARVEIVSRVADGRLRLLIDDDGPGLDGEAREAVFARGLRLDARVPGSGLGLPIVRDLAELYGGGIELGRSPLGGLRAALTLPAGTAGNGSL